jgi:L-iditol 2-dehydrogenase
MQNRTLMLHHFCTGLLTLIAAKAFGATRLMITDINPTNLARAEKMGAKTYCHSSTASPADIAKELKGIMAPNGPEIVIDCVGFDSTAETAALTCSPGGTVVLVGLGHDQVKLPLNSIVVHELDVKGSFAYVDTVSTTVGTTVMFTVMYA